MYKNNISYITNISLHFSSALLGQNQLPRDHAKNFQLEYQSKCSFGRAFIYITELLSLVASFRSSKKKYHVMRFNSSLGVDFTKWKSQNIQVKMERENNLKEFKGTEEEMPK